MHGAASLEGPCLDHHAEPPPEQPVRYGCGPPSRAIATRSRALRQPKDALTPSAFSVQAAEQWALDRAAIPRIRSPSQWPGTARSSTSAGRSLISTMCCSWPEPVARPSGRRCARPVRRRWRRWARSQTPVQNSGLFQTLHQRRSGHGHERSGTARHEGQGEGASASPSGLCSR